MIVPEPPFSFAVLRELIEIDVSMRNPSLGEVGRNGSSSASDGETLSTQSPRRRILYETSGESCSPGIAASDWNAIFEEQLIVPRLKYLFSLVA